MSAEAVTAAYRARTIQVRAGTYRDMLTIWPAFSPDDPAAYRAWLTGASAIVRRDRERFALLARQYLAAHAESVGRAAPGIVAAERLPAEQLATSLRVTSLVAYAKARGAGHQAPEALRIAAVSSSGSATRLALNGGRSLIQQTAQAGGLRGWRRVGNPQCNLCRTILGRFYPARTADFKCHDHCACAFEPVYP